MKTLKQQMHYIMKHFDFQRVADSMKLLNWSYGGKETPSVSQLRERAQAQMSELIKDASSGEPPEYHKQHCEELGIDWRNEPYPPAVRTLTSGGFVSTIINGQWLKLAFVLTDMEWDD